MINPFHFVAAAVATSATAVLTQDLLLFTFLYEILKTVGDGVSRQKAVTATVVDVVVAAISMNFEVEVTYTHRDE